MSRCLRIKEQQPVKTLPFVHECLILTALEHDRGRTVAAQNLQNICLEFDFCQRRPYQATGGGGVH